MDVIVYRQRSFKEAWLLLVPSGKEDILSTERVVELYRRRMNIEVTFRDFKSQLGVRGLSLRVRKGQSVYRGGGKSTYQTTGKLPYRSTGKST